jgi:hypothetical protein
VSFDDPRTREPDPWVAAGPALGSGINVTDLDPDWPRQYDADRPGDADGGTDLADRCSGLHRVSGAEQRRERVDCGGDLVFREAAEAGQQAPLRAWRQVQW